MTSRESPKEDMRLELVYDGKIDLTELLHKLQGNWKVIEAYLTKEKAQHGTYTITYSAVQQRETSIDLKGVNINSIVGERFFPKNIQIRAAEFWPKQYGSAPIDKIAEIRKQVIKDIGNFNSYDYILSGVVSKYVSYGNLNEEGTNICRDWMYNDAWVCMAALQANPHKLVVETHFLNEGALLKKMLKPLNFSYQKSWQERMLGLEKRLSLFKEGKLESVCDERPIKLKLQKVK